MGRFLRILYLEDDSDDVAILRSMLQVVDPTGFNLCVVSSQAQAIHQLQHEKFDLVITDYSLRQTGAGTSEELIRCVTERSDFLPMIVLTSHRPYISQAIMDLLEQHQVQVCDKEEMSPAWLQSLLQSMVDASC